MFWALAPPCIYFLIWGGKTASDLDPALLSRVAYRKSCWLTIICSPLPPWPVARKSKGQETNIWGQGCSASISLSSPPCRMGHWRIVPPCQDFSPSPPYWGPSTCLTSHLPLFLLCLMGASTLTCPLRITQSGCLSFLCALPSLWPWV